MCSGTEVPGTEMMVFFSTKCTLVLEPAWHPTEIHMLISILVHIVYNYTYKDRNASSYSSTASCAFMAWAWTLTPYISVTGNENKKLIW
jgi:hypothetical protein